MKEEILLKNTYNALNLIHHFKNNNLRFLQPMLINFYVKEEKLKCLIINTY